MATRPGGKIVPHRPKLDRLVPDPEISMMGTEQPAFAGAVAGCAVFHGTLRFCAKTDGRRRVVFTLSFR